MDPRFTNQQSWTSANTSSETPWIPQQSNPGSCLISSGLILNFGTPQTQQPTMSGTGPTYQIQDSNPLTIYPEPGPLAPGYLHTRSSTQARTWQTPGWGQPRNQSSTTEGSTHHIEGAPIEHIDLVTKGECVAEIYRITSMKGHLSKVWIVTYLLNT